MGTPQEIRGYFGKRGGKEGVKGQLLVTTHLLVSQEVTYMHPHLGGKNVPAARETIDFAPRRKARTGQELDF